MGKRYVRIEWADICADRSGVASRITSGLSRLHDDVDGVGRRQMNAKHRLGDGIASVERECT